MHDAFAYYEKESMRLGLFGCMGYSQPHNDTIRGISIGQYIRELRMGRALELLTTHRYSILEIAHAVGYSNPSQFSAAFKKFYGKAPTWYFS